MAGAAVLCARGALRSGAGLVSISVPDELVPIMQVAVPEAVCLSRSFSELSLAQFDVVVLGPGLGVGRDQEILVRNILERYNGVLILDADALTAFASEPKSLFEAIRAEGATVVMTPHEGEFGRLFPDLASASGSKVERARSGAGLG